MKTRPSRTHNTSLAATIAPEDIRPGQYVAVLYEVSEYPSFFWFDGVGGVPEDPVRVRFCPEEGGLPLKVRAVCLPFLFVKPPGRAAFTLDVRRVHLARLAREYARAVWRETPSKR